MESDALEFARLSNTEIDELDRESTLFVMALSPLEIHGPHLPLGTDALLAEDVRNRSLEKIRERHPDIQFVVLPTCHIGSDTLPGSINVDSRAINYVLRATADNLADRGFHYLLVTDNHGGPRHQLATAKAVQRLYRRRGFRIIAPFLRFYRRMVEDDPELLRRTGTVPGECGDMDDCHAGLNETSLMLYAHPELVGPIWEELPPVGIDRHKWPSLLLGPVGPALRALGFSELAEDVKYLNLVLCLASERPPLTYVGEPNEATPGAGELMLDTHAEECADQVDSALKGEKPYHKPLGWSLRFLEFSL